MWLYKDDSKRSEYQCDNGSRQHDFQGGEKHAGEGRITAKTRNGEMENEQMRKRENVKMASLEKTHFTYKVFTNLLASLVTMSTYLPKDHLN